MISHVVYVMCDGIIRAKDWAFKRCLSTDS